MVKRLSLECVFSDDWRERKSIKSGKFIQLEMLEIPHKTIRKLSSLVWFSPCSCWFNWPGEKKLLQKMEKFNITIIIKHGKLSNPFSIWTFLMPFLFLLERPTTTTTWFNEQPQESLEKRKFSPLLKTQTEFNSFFGRSKFNWEKSSLLVGWGHRAIELSFNGGKNMIFSCDEKLRELIQLNADLLLLCRRPHWAYKINDDGEKMAEIIFLVFNSQAPVLM